MKKEIYGICVGTGLALSGGIVLAAQYGDQSKAPQQKQIAEALMTGGTGHAERHHDEAVTVGADIAFGVGFLAVAYGLVGLIDDLPEKRRAVTPVGIPTQQASTDTVSEQAPQGIPVYETP